MDTDADGGAAQAAQGIAVPQEVIVVTANGNGRSTPVAANGCSFSASGADLRSGATTPVAEFHRSRRGSAVLNRVTAAAVAGIRRSGATTPRVALPDGCAARDTSRQASGLVTPMTAGLATNSDCWGSGAATPQFSAAAAAAGLAEPPMSAAAARAELDIPQGTHWKQAVLMYRRLALLYHPASRNADAARFARVNRAWYWLCRRTYHGKARASMLSYLPKYMEDLLRQHAESDECPVIDPVDVYNRTFGLKWRLPECVMSPLRDTNTVHEPTPAGATWFQGHLDHVANKFLEPLRMKSCAKLNTGLDTWGQRELAALQTTIPEGYHRVLCIRHGMGKHNDLAGAASHRNRDAELNAAGRAEADLVSCVLRAAGVIEATDFVVVSPFRRALQTSLRIFGDDAPGKATCVSPRAAEHSLFDHPVQRGDMGESTATLRTRFPQQMHPQFKRFQDVDDYCVQTNCIDGQWWHHGEALAETQESFSRRAAEFRVWLWEQAHARGSRLTVVVSHGGLLTKAFRCEEFGHCEFRTFDVTEGGFAIRTATGEEVPMPSPTGSAREEAWLTSPQQSCMAGGRSGRWESIPELPVFDEKEIIIVIIAVRCSAARINGHYEYTVEGHVTPHGTVCQAWRLSEMRALLHDHIKSELGEVEYARLGLKHMFPNPWWIWGHAQMLRRWLVRIAECCREDSFPESLKNYVALFLSGCATASLYADPFDSSMSTRRSRKAFSTSAEQSHSTAVEWSVSRSVSGQVRPAPAPGEPSPPRLMTPSTPRRVAEPVISSAVSSVCEALQRAGSSRRGTGTARTRTPPRVPTPASA
eukprot:TRINITY_DN1488_c0_g1_i1.p1 TRINITY_DN1488_c0_g1~~TRINITY_DN1488_c0_g1_i1.p1  ORF type:complete len:858 (+),score=231.33 TRINITY_DN1488_c0_g1_i1:127-2574(+)